MRFGDRLARELTQRRHKNPRYSARAFARFLGVDHATLSRLLRGRTAVSARTLARLAAPLDLSPRELYDYRALEVEHAVVQAARRPLAASSSRRLSSLLGVPLDDVNVALQSLLRKRVLEMPERGRLRVRAEPAE